MEIENLFKCYVEGYFGIREIDEYDLKEYILKDVEKYIKEFISEYYDSNFDYKKEAEYIKDNISIITKLQSSLIVLNKINGPMELVLLIKKKIKNLKENI